MRARPFFRTLNLRSPDPALLRGALLCVCFALGAAAGHGYALACQESVSSALGAYLTDYCAVYDPAQMDLAACLLQYFGYNLLVFLLGFSAVGVLLIPASAGLFGFLSMYTVSCFVQCFGRSGVLLAMGALLVRLLFSLPCFLTMAGTAWPLATELALLTLGKGRRSAPVLYGSRYFLLFFVCCVILTVGVCCERFLTPLLFRLALEGVFG